jgi:hypothetical protein
MLILMSDVNMTNATLNYEQHLLDNQFNFNKIFSPNSCVNLESDMN